MELKYYTCIGIIDYFELTMTKEEAIEKVANDIRPWEEEPKKEYKKQAIVAINNIENSVKKIINDIENEIPHTIRYFAIPNYDKLCVVAKIYNNGSTYVFSPDKDFLKYLGADEEDIYQFK